jgi:hypothetical protein
METNQEKLEAKQETDEERIESMKATQVLATLQGRASYVLHGGPKEGRYKEKFGAARNGFRDQHLGVG